MNRIAVRFTLAMLAVMFITAIVEASLIGYSLYVAYTRLPDASKKVFDKIFPESDDPFRFTDNETNLLILAQVGVLVIGVIVALLVARRISRPLLNVSQTAARVARGDLSARAPVSRRRGGDETATLLRNFNAMADSLERLEGERRATSAAIAHELRTPLTILRGRLEAIRDEIITLDGKEISNLLSQTEVLSRLVTDLRTLSLADAGQLSLERQTVDVRALVAQVVSSFEARAGDRGMKLEFVCDLQKGVSRLDAPIDSSRIIQVIANLIENAIRYAPEGGFARISLNSNLAEAIITVRDSGAGIEADQLERVFDRFYRTDASRSRFTGGSGLGLAIVRAMVELHGGRITVRNHPEGGAEFEVRLPRTLEMVKAKPKTFWARSLDKSSNRTLDPEPLLNPTGGRLEPSDDAAQIYEAGTVSNLTYLFLSFPLGLSYFIAIIIGLALGFPLTLIFGLGIPFLIFTLWLSLQGAALERWLNDTMLGIPVPFTARTSSPKRFRDRLMLQLRDPYSWRAALYLLLKFPFGLAALVLMLGLIGTALFCMFAPIGYATGVFEDDLLIFELRGWTYKVNSIQRSLTVAFAGLILAAISFPILNLLAHWWGRFARVMLSNTADLEPAPSLERPLKARPGQS